MPRKYVLWLIGIGSAIVVLLIALIVIVAIDDGGEPSAVATEAPTTMTTNVPPTTAAATPTTVEATTMATIPPSTEPPPPTTVAPTTTATTTPTPPSLGPVCIDVGSRPGTRTNETTVTGDFDGDGDQDLFAVYKLGSPWFLWARLSGGGGSYRLVTEISLPWSFQYWDGTAPNNLAAIDANSLGDPRDVATVRLYAGLGQYFGLFAVEDCEIIPFVTEAGTIPSLYQAMGANHSDFPVCDPTDRVVRQVAVSCGGPVSTCPSLDLVASEWEVFRDPARLTVGAAYARTIDQTEYGELVADSCIG